MILVTGASGFVGRQLCRHLQERGEQFRMCMRHAYPNTISVGDINESTDWNTALLGVQVVIHLAGRAHVLNHTLPYEFRRVNVEGTLNLASQAAAAGVKRFIFVSSIGVNGNRTVCSPFSESDQPNPQEPYAVSKWEAEKLLLNLAAETDMELVIIRPPLVYGSNAPGNFGRLYRLVRRGIPLPLGAIRNHRSLVALENLVDLIITCIGHPSAVGQTFLVSDGEDVSTPDLIRRIAFSMGRTVRLIPVPYAILVAGMTLLGRRELATRLCGSLQVDITKARKVLGWTPPVKMDDALRFITDHFLENLPR